MHDRGRHTIEPGHRYSHILLTLPDIPTADPHPIHPFSKALPYCLQSATASRLQTQYPPTVFQAVSCTLNQFEVDPLPPAPFCITRMLPVLFMDKLASSFRSNKTSMEAGNSTGSASGQERMTVPPLVVIELTAFDPETRVGVSNRPSKMLVTVPDPFCKVSKFDTRVGDLCGVYAMQ